MRGGAIPHSGSLMLHVDHYFGLLELMDQGSAASLAAYRHPLGSDGLPPAGSTRRTPH